ncbi:MAG: uridine kinase [Simkaniaceae bacterium]
MLKFFLLFCCVSCQMLFAAPQKILIGIAGGSGSGKTTLAQKIQEAFPGRSILISQDSYYKDLSHLGFQDRIKVNFDHPDSVDFALLCKHLKDLKNDAAVDRPVYNFHTNTREKYMQKIHPAPLIIVEGILLFAIPEIRDLLDLKIFVEVEDDIRILRRIERDILERSRDFTYVREQYLSTVRPMHLSFVEPSKKFADIIIPEGGFNRIALKVILAKLQEDLNNQK